MKPTPSAEPDANRTRVRGPEVESPKKALWSRPTLSVLTLLGLALVVQFTPGLEATRLFGQLPTVSAATPAPMPTSNEVGETELTMESRVQPGMAQPEHVELPKSPRGPIGGQQKLEPLVQINAKKPPVPLEDESGKALDGFYAALSRTQRKDAGAITRVAHFGDSIVVSDYVSGTLRRNLQDEFGDAGHGYMLIANAWPAYFHNDVYRFASRGWMISRIVGPMAKDGLYGLGGVSFRAPPGARARFGTAEKGNYGRNVSRFLVSYLEQPDGGKFKLNIDGEFHSEIDTSAPEKRSAFTEVRVPDGPHRLELVTSSGSVRAFGVVLERDQPGVVLDALGVQGARIRFLDKQDDAHWAEQLKWRKPDLIIYQFGANESGDGFLYPMKEYYRTMRLVLEQGRKALPEAGCLIIAAMDRARKKGDQMVSMPVIPALVKEQRKAARDVGCAFFNTFEAMGGHGSMPTWVRRGLGQADMTHPTAVGSQVLGHWIYRALMLGFDEYVAENNARAGITSPAPEAEPGAQDPAKTQASSSATSPPALPTERALPTEHALPTEQKP